MQDGEALGVHLAMEEQGERGREQLSQQKESPLGQRPS
jgi:hypothetical protein